MTRVQMGAQSTWKAVFVGMVHFSPQADNWAQHGFVKCEIPILK